jgi:putative protein kinase ArgK-like GTPase of G3E family
VSGDACAASQLEKIDMLDFADVIALNKFDKRGALDALRDVKKQYKRNNQLWDVNQAIDIGRRVEPYHLFWLEDVVARHAKLTGSAVAAELTRDWDRHRTRFVKVMPRDYQRVLEAIRVAREQGRDVDEAVMEAAGG